MNATKRIFYFIAALAIVATSCSDNNDLVVPLDDSIESDATALYSNKVSLNLVETLAKSQSIKSRAGGMATKLSCYTRDKDTLFYVIDNPKGGWTLYSTDKRVSPIIATSDKGTFKDALKNDNLRFWLDHLGQKMQRIKTMADAGLKISAKDIEANKDFWLSIEDPDAFIRKSGVLKTAILPSRYGHYEFFSQTSETSVYDEIPRLTTTDWSQSQYTNLACPWNDDKSKRCPAGCVAIASGQMLYFLHYKYGVPAEAPTTAYCNSKYNEKPYDWAQTNYTTYVWDGMDRFGVYSHALIADIGRRLKMNYSPNGSAASDGDLKNTIFYSYGIDCTKADYSESDLERNLRNSMPVILSASDMNNHKNAHTFICDRYRRTQTTITTTYVWVYDEYPTNPDGTLIPVPMLPDKVETSHTMPAISSIGFNWGNGFEVNNSQEWFSVSGPWDMPLTTPTPDYRLNVIMYMDFKPLNQ